MERNQWKGTRNHDKVENHWRKVKEKLLRNCKTQPNNEPGQSGQKIVVRKE